MISIIINKFFQKLFGVGFVLEFPRHSIRFANAYFGMRKIDVVEVGTNKGINAENITENLNVRNLFLIDIKFDSIAFSNKYIADNIKFIEEHSDDATSFIPKVDFIYIDGDHSYIQSYQDMNHYWNKLNDGGIMAGHDVTSHHNDYGVAKAFVKFCSEHNLKPYISRTDWWVVKPKSI